MTTTQDDAKSTKASKPERELTIKEQLAAQPKYRIRLRHELGKKDQKKEGALSVGINGHFFFIQRGQYVDVPEEVYLVLVRAGEVEPQKPEHEDQIPDATRADAPAHVDDQE